MREDTMPGEALVSNGAPAANRLKGPSQNAVPSQTLQEMAEKLEKSETGRKKLRQAISMLKEKVEANEKVLQVNEILRQECEKERLRAEAERNRAEEEKTLREEIEKEGLSTKEQLVRILQRLDAVEQNRESDRSEVERMRKETKQAVSGLSGAVKTIEAAHLSFQDLEKNLLGKVTNAISASTKSPSLAQTGITSEILKCGIKMDTNSHKKDENPVVLLKDITKLLQKERKSRSKIEQKLAALQRVLQIGNNCDSAKQPLLEVSADKTRKRKRRSALEDSSKKTAFMQDTAASFDVTLDETLVAETHGCKVRGDNGAEAGEVKARGWERNENFAEEELHSCHQVMASKSCHSQARGHADDVSEERFDVTSSKTHGCKVRGDNGVEAGEVKVRGRGRNENLAEKDLPSRHHVMAAKSCHSQARGHVDDVTEERFDVTSSKTLVVEAQGCHVRGEEVSETGEVKASRLGRTDDVIENVCPTPHQLAATKSCHSLSRGQNDGVPRDSGKCVLDTQDLENLHLADVGVEDVSATADLTILQGLTAATAEFVAPCRGMEMDAENLSRGELNREWDTDSESSDDGYGDDWWATKRVLLSPSLPEVLPPLPLLEVPESNPLLAWPAGSEMDLEDIDHFLEVLPPIDQDACGQGRMKATLSDVVDLKAEDADLPVQVVLTGANMEDVKSQRKLEAETVSYPHTCRESSSSNDLVHPFSRGLNPSDNRGDCAEENKENVIGGISFSSATVSCTSRPIASVLVPQEANVVRCGKSTGLGSISTPDSGISADGDVRDSQGVVKQEEKLDAVPLPAMDLCEDLSQPYSLELVLDRVTGESEMISSCSTLQTKPCSSITEISRKIFMAFGRIQKLLHGALDHTNSEALRSSMAMATAIASMFVSSSFSKLDLICIFTASLVDMHALLDYEKNPSYLIPEFNLLERLLEVVKQVFQRIMPPDEAFSMFADQLQMFLIHGILHPVCQATREQSLEVGSAKGHFFYFTLSMSKLKRLKVLISGSKLFATFCETSGKLAFLRNSVYLTLRFCDMDSLCLLASISSFACVSCKSLFSVDNEDLVGQAVLVVMSELLSDAEVDRERETSFANVPELETQEGSGSGTEGNLDLTQLLGKLFLLRDIIDKEDNQSFEAFVPKLLESFHRLINTTFGSHLSDNGHVLQRSLRMRTCNEVEITKQIKNLIAFSRSEEHREACPSTVVTGSTSSLQIGENEELRNPAEEYCWGFARDKSSEVYSALQPVDRSELEIKLTNEWEQKFYDIANAMELVASHLGWEWTYNDLIVGQLWKLVTPGAPAMTVACVAYLFGLLGRLGREVDNTELPGVDELRKSLLVVMSSDPSTSRVEGYVHEFSFWTQVAAAQSLLVLSTFNRTDTIIPSKGPGNVFTKGSELHEPSELQAQSINFLLKWAKGLKPETQEMLPSSLRLLS